MRMTEFISIELVPGTGWFTTSFCKHLTMHTLTDEEDGAWQAILDSLCDH